MGIDNDTNTADDASQAEHRRFLNAVEEQATQEQQVNHSRRKFLKGVGTVGAAAAATTGGVALGKASWGGESLKDAFGDFFQDHYKRMTPEEIQDALARIERKAKRRFGVDITCENTPPKDGVVFGYALNIAKCQGYRDCVEACVKENNHGRESQMQYIRVVELDHGDLNLENSNHHDLVLPRGCTAFVIRAHDCSP